MERSVWPDCLRAKCYDEYTGVLLADDLVDIRTNNSFRPSFPMGDISANVEVPIYLVQHNNADWLLADRKYDCRDDCCYIQINSKNETETVFKCNAKIQVTENLVGLTTNQIKGYRNRTILCQWGQRACFGFSNLEEIEHFCDEYDVYKKFRSPSYCRYNSIGHVPDSVLSGNRSIQ